MLIFTVSCSEKDDNSLVSQVGASSQLDLTESELIRWEADKNICYDYKQLENDSEVIIIGTVIDDMKTEHTMGSSNGIEDEVLIYISSTSTVRIDKVLKGDLKVGDEITVSQDCGQYKDQFVTFSDMEPLIKGDQWIFCLCTVDGKDEYFFAGDYSSRFPVPDSQTASLSRSADTDSKALLQNKIDKMTNEDFGVYEDISPMKDVYLDVITNYDCTLQ